MHLALVKQLPSYSKMADTMQWTFWMLLLLLSNTVIEMWHYILCKYQTFISFVKYNITLKSFAAHCYIWFSLWSKNCWENLAYLFSFALIFMLRYGTAMQDILIPTLSASYPVHRHLTYKPDSSCAALLLL